MPNFKKNDGFALGGSPFTMKKGSKELDTEGSFRQEAMGKMGSYGSPLFAIKSDGINAGLDAMVESKKAGDAAKEAGMPVILLEDGYTEKNTTEIYHNHLVKDFVGIEKIVTKYF